jgi:hypothetical protein
MGTPWHKTDAAHHPAPSRAMAIGCRTIGEIPATFFAKDLEAASF